MAPERVIVDQKVIEGFRGIDPACVSDVVQAEGLRGTVHGIYPLDRRMRICGPAVTMRQISSRDSRNWARHEAVLMMCQPGDVLVMDFGGRVDGAPWGFNVTREARTRGLEGTVVDGATRDSEEIVEMGYPTFVRGVTIPHTHGLFYSTCLNTEPVQIGVFPYAVMVAPGDIIVDGADGLVVVPAERAAKLLEKAKRRHEHDLRSAALFASGKVHGDPEIDAQIAGSRAMEGVKQAEGYKW